MIDLNGQPPDDARIVYRYTGRWSAAGEESQEKFTIAGEPWSRARKTSFVPFEYRAVGGDDDTMPWIAVEVVEPPAVESIAMTLYPPEYTGWPRVIGASDSRHFAAPCGVDAVRPTGRLRPQPSARKTGLTCRCEWPTTGSRVRSRSRRAIRHLVDRRQVGQVLDRAARSRWI